nr:uncharacterized mitochondrial protein AtMg00810-like [Tanacetum cinerariifolium]
METQKPLLKDEDGKEVDVHMYRYLKGQPKLGLGYPKDSLFDLVAYTDSDYAGASLEGKSTTGVKEKKRVRLMMEKMFGMELEFMMTQQPRKPKRKDTQVPQPSDPIENVLDEAIHKELSDSLARAATTASSLEAEHNNETMEGTTAQIKFESVSKHSNDSLLLRGNTLRSDEDSLKLDKLMALCTTLQNRVVDLEKTTTTQPRIESSGDEETLGDVQDEVVSNDSDKDIFDVDVLDDNDAGDIVSNASVATTTTAIITTVGDITLAQALKEIKSTKPKEKGVIIQELGKSTTTKSSQQLQDKAKRAKDKRNKPPTKPQQRKIMCTYLKNMEGYKLKDLKLKEFDYIQEMFEKSIKRVNIFEYFRTKLVEDKEKRARTELIQEIIKKQQVEDDKETKELKQFMEINLDEEEVATDAIPLFVKSSKIVD